MKNIMYYYSRVFILTFLYWSISTEIISPSLASSSSWTTLLDETRLSWYPPLSNPNMTNDTVTYFNQSLSLSQNFESLSLIEQLEIEYTHLMLDNDISDPQYVLDISALTDVPLLFCNNRNTNNTTPSSTEEKDTLVPFYIRQFGLKPTCVLQINFLRVTMGIKKPNRRLDDESTRVVYSSSSSMVSTTRSSFTKKHYLPVNPAINTTIHSSLRSLSTPVINCSSYSNCSTCMGPNSDAVLVCYWCPAVQNCRSNRYECPTYTVVRPYQCSIDYSSYSDVYPFLGGTALSSNPYQSFKMGTKPCTNTVSSLFPNISIPTSSSITTDTCSYTDTVTNKTIYHDLLRRSGAAVLVHHAYDAKSAVCILGGAFANLENFYDARKNSTDSVLCSFDGIEWSQQTPLPVLCSTPIAVSHQGRLFVTGCLNRDGSLNSTVWCAELHINVTNYRWFITKWRQVSLTFPLPPNTNQPFMNSAFIAVSQYTDSNDIPYNPSLLLGISQTNLETFLVRRYWLKGTMVYDDDSRQSNQNLMNTSVDTIVWNISYTESIDGSVPQWLGIGTIQYFRMCSKTVQDYGIFCYGGSNDTLWNGEMVMNETTSNANDPYSSLPMFSRSPMYSTLEKYESVPLSTAQRLVLIDQNTLIHINSSLPILKDSYTASFFSTSFWYPVPNTVQKLPWTIDNTLAIRAIRNILKVIVVRNRVLVWPDEFNEPSFILYRTKESYTGYFTPCQSCNRTLSTEKVPSGKNDTTWYGCRSNPFEPVCTVCKKCNSSEYIHSPCTEYTDTVCKPCTVCENGLSLLKPCNSFIPYGNTECGVVSSVNNEIIQNYLDSINLIDNVYREPLLTVFILVIVSISILQCTYVWSRMQKYMQQVHAYLLRKSIVAGEDNNFQKDTPVNARSETILTEKIFTRNSNTGSDQSYHGDDEVPMDDEYDDHFGTEVSSYRRNRTSSSTLRTGTSDSLGVTISNAPSTSIGLSSLGNSTGSVIGKKEISIPYFTSDASVATISADSARTERLSIDRWDQIKMYPAILSYILVNDKTVWILFNVSITLLQIFCCISWLMMMPWACIIPTEEVYYSSKNGNTVTIGGTVGSCSSRYMTSVLLTFSFLVGCTGTPLFLRYYRRQGAVHLLREVSQKQRLWFSVILFVNLLSLRNISLWMLIDRLLDQDIVSMDSLKIDPKWLKRIPSSKVSSIDSSSIPSTDNPSSPSSVSFPTDGSLSSKVSENSSLGRSSVQTSVSYLSSVSVPLSSLQRSQSLSVAHPVVNTQVPHWMVEIRKQVTIVVGYISIGMFLLDCLHVVCIWLAISHPEAQTNTLLVNLLLTDAIVTVICIFASFMEYIPIFLCGKYYFSSIIVPGSGSLPKPPHKLVVAATSSNYGSDKNERPGGEGLTKHTNMKDILPILKLSSNTSIPPVPDPVMVNPNRFMNNGGVATGNGTNFPLPSPSLPYTNNAIKIAEWSNGGVDDEKKIYRRNHSKQTGTQNIMDRGDRHGNTKNYAIESEPSKEDYITIANPVTRVTLIKEGLRANILPLVLEENGSNSSNQSKDEYLGKVYGSVEQTVVGSLASVTSTNDTG